MSSLLDSLSGHLDDQSLRRISGALGADQGATSKALAAAVPLLIAGLARNAAQPSGAQQLHDALARDHDGSALDRPPTGATPDGDAILGHILGDRRAAAEKGISGASGLDLAKTGVIQGMSGSPTYMEGKLLGAVAYAWQFGKQPIAGVTPFVQMREFADFGERLMPVLKDVGIEISGEPELLEIHNIVKR